MVNRQEGAPEPSVPAEDVSGVAPIGVEPFADRSALQTGAGSSAAPGSEATKAGPVWTAIAVGIVVLAVVVVFMLENLQEVRVSFFGAHWRAPLAVDLLLAALLGGSVVFSAGTVRFFQLRARDRRRKRAALPGGRAGWRHRPSHA